MNVQARYGLNPDKEVLEILQAASKAKQVITPQRLLNCSLNYLVYVCIRDHLR
jgi:hypothetical protein